MDMLVILTAVADWAGWYVVAILVILGSGVGLWVTNQRIEGLKEQNEWLKIRLGDAEKFTPSALVERYASRHKILSDELELLHVDNKANEQRIKEIETEKKKITEELDNIASSLFRAIESCSLRCQFCYSDGRNTRHVGIPVARDGERYLIDIESICKDCGHKTISISNTN